MKKPRLSVTDHAVIRYLERVRGFDVEAVRREIGHIVDIAEPHEAACSVISGGHRYIISENRVITVTPQHQRSLKGRGR